MVYWFVISYTSTPNWKLIPQRSAIIHPDSPLKITPDRALVLTNAALGNKVVEHASRTTLLVHQTGVMGGFGAITSLRVGQLECFSFYVRLTKGVEFVIEVEGKNPISLIGYWDDRVHATTPVATAGGGDDDSKKKRHRKDHDDETQAKKRRKEEKDAKRRRDYDADNAEPGPSDLGLKRRREASDNEEPTKEEQRKRRKEEPK
ncbi:hypothetical protein PQX77_011715 [Marasmius sp. AFHP31]|nr:hypothetical protein PQX77_011715 [Marasmius sp. AFHP31]